MEAVTFLEILDRHEFGDVTVGDVVHTLDTFQELVAVLHYHQFLATDQALLIVKYLGPDAGVVTVRALVGAAKNHRVVF